MDILLTAGLAALAGLLAGAGIRWIRSRCTRCNGVLVDACPHCDAKVVDWAGRIARTLAREPGTRP
ncbi:hypothetical protein AB0B31_29640 [Catellatospora citrea]|uniref:hypothetical protein n=1 Tax=Catellatospora citrea TaxID=53366 RepID=UPI00340A535B